MPAKSIKIKAAKAREARVDNLFFPRHFRRPPVFKKKHDRAGDEHRRICSKNNTDQQGQSKIVDDCPAEKKQGQHRQENGERSQNGSAQRLINTQINNIAQLLFGIQLHIFPDSVEHNDGIVNGETDNEEYRCQNRYSEFHIQKRNSADDNNDIVNQSDNPAQSVAELKTPADINQHGQPRKNDG